MKIGFTCGSFDLLHAGHVVMLKEAKNNCDYLIVGLQTDPNLDRKNKNIPIQSIYERFVQLSAIKFVDEILVYDSENSLLDLLESTPIDIRFVGDDYKNKNFTGKGIGKTFFTNRKHTFSTTSLRERIKKEQRNVAD